MAELFNLFSVPSRFPHRLDTSLSSEAGTALGQAKLHTRSGDMGAFREPSPHVDVFAGTTRRGVGGPLPQVADEAVSDKTLTPDVSLYSGAYDGRVASERRLRRLFARPGSLDRQIRTLRIRPDDIAKARELGLVSDVEAQRLANASLDALEKAGFTKLPKEIRYTHGGPFYFELGKDDAETLRTFKVAVGLNPDRRASQKTNSEEKSWDYEALQKLQADGKLRVVDRFGQEVDILSSSAIDGRQEQTLNLKLSYRSIDYEHDDEDGDAKRRNALNGDKVMIEAWNQDLSRPQPDTVYEIPSYEMPAFNGERVDIHSDETKLWRFETLPEPGADGGGRVGRVTGQINLVARPRDQIEARLTEKLGETPDESTLNDAVREHERKRGWARNQGMQYVRYQKDQTPAGNQAMIDAGMRVPQPGVPYNQTHNRYNGGHVLAASIGGFGEGLNVTAQAEANNQDRRGRMIVTDKNGEVQSLFANESWHDWERHLKNLSEVSDKGLTVNELQAQGFTVPPSILKEYGGEQRLRFNVETSIRMWHEDEASDVEAQEDRHTRELARFTVTRLVHKESGSVLGELTMANYNVGQSDEDYAEKTQMLFDAGFLDRDGGYANDLDMSAFDGAKERAPDVSGAGTLDESLPTYQQLLDFVRSEDFKQVWGRNNE